MKSLSPARVSVDNVTKRVGRKAVLEGITLDVPARSFTAIVGPSGCGKSTLINLIAGYDRPDAGRIAVDGVLVQGPGWDRLVVFQETALFPWKSTLDNVLFGPRNRGIAPGRALHDAGQLLAKFGLAGFEAKYPTQLSGGMQRRAELARALINCPRAMLLDEPFRGLDALTRELMQEYLLRVFEEQPITTLFVTSEVEESIYLADRVIVLSTSPAVVKDVIEIDLPRPRDVSMLSSTRFGEIHRRILRSLFEEVSKVFAEGSQGAADLLLGAAGYGLRRSLPDTIPVTAPAPAAGETWS